jgi:AAA+ ATPase superfamily predicted ATPase
VDPYFVGRHHELQQLNLLLKKRTSSLVVVKGRRRIGKSRLLEEFGKSFSRVFSFSGLYPTKKTTTKDQMDHFGWQLGTTVGELPFKDDDWNSLFLRLANYTRDSQVLIILDEISWIGSLDPNFLGKLKDAWDKEFKKNPKLVLVLCGSVSTWIEDNILSSTGYFGRISLSLTVQELPLHQCKPFLEYNSSHISAYEKFKILSVTGGVPKYLEEIHPELPAEKNIKNLCFESSGLLFNEFKYIFIDIFSNRGVIYQKVVESLTDGSLEQDEIRKILNLQKGGTLSEYLDALVTSGFIRRDYTWNLKTRKKSGLSHFRISDNYLRFYLKFIAPNKEEIEKNAFRTTSLTLLPGWEGMMGLQFENLVLNNRHKILELLNISPDEVLFDNPFFQHKTIRTEACQVDYLIQTRFDTVYICEIKFSKHPIKANIMHEIQEKIRKINAPRHISFRPVLIHVNGVTEEVTDSRYFSNMIGFSQLFNNHY